MNTEKLEILEDARTGGPANPSFATYAADTGDLVANADQGITKRDWFATMGDGQLSVPRALILMGYEVPADSAGAMKWWATAEAKYRYLKADAMMEARK